MRSIIDRLKGSRDFPRLRIGKVFHLPSLQDIANVSVLFLVLQIGLCFMFHVSGIGRPPGKMDTANYVLRQFNKQEQEEV